jgi:hypothetical protein
MLQMEAAGMKMNGWVDNPLGCAIYVHNLTFYTLVSSLALVCIFCVL